MKHEVSGIPRVGIVLSSGGVRGVYAHTGFMQAIQRLGLPVSACAGCSAGALVGGFIASGVAIEDWAATLAVVTSRTFWTPDSLPRFIWKMTAHRGRGYTGLSDTDAAMQFTRDHLAVNTFDQCLYPFHVLAVNLGTGRKVIFSEGELAPRMTASAAMPVLYRPVRIEDQYYCDGAVADFAPADAICCRHGLDAVIVHHVSQSLSAHDDIDAALEDTWAMLEIINRLVFREHPWYLSDDPVTFQQCPCDCGAIIIAIEPELPTMRWPVTRGGDGIRRSAREQAESLLQPYMAAILNNPREQLLASTGHQTHAPGRCGNHDAR